VRAGYELVNPGTALRGVLSAQPAIRTLQDRQFTFDFTKRWSW
jgi:hypothetical protein